MIGDNVNDVVVGLLISTLNNYDVEFMYYVSFSSS